jgi:hypothetical protein
MFKQAKKARELMGDHSYTHDEFNWIQITLTVIFSIALVGIWYYSKKADTSVKENLNTHNPIIEDIQAGNNLEDVVENYGNINYDK